jgi:phage head maturation protease
MTRPVAGDLETRSAPDVELDGPRLRGLIPYGVESRDLGGWREVMDANCLEGTELRDLVATVDHTGLPIGRHPGTLQLEQRDDGLHWSLELPSARGDIREAVERGDLCQSSWRMVVGEDEWRGEVRHIRRVDQLRDVAVVTTAAYEAATAEYRNREGGAVTETAVEETTTEDRGDPRESETPEPTPARGTLRAEDRSIPVGPSGGLADRFRAAGFPAEAATLPFDEVLEEARALTWTGNVDRIDPTRVAGVPLGADQRYAWPAFPRVGVDAGATSVDVMRQSARTLAAAADVIRPIDATTAKPETSSVLEVVPTALKQVASVQTGIPNVYLEQAAFNTVVENDLRLAVNGGLDKLVLDALAAAGHEDPATGPLLVAIRKAITTIEAAGYSPNTLILRPQDAEALDTLRVNATDELYVFQPGAAAPGTIYGLQRRVSKAAPSPIVVDTRAFGKLYSSPVSLQRFEADAGTTNKSNVRLELHAVFGTERVAAAVRIAAS